MRWYVDHGTSDEDGSFGSHHVLDNYVDLSLFYVDLPDRYVVLS